MSTLHIDPDELRPLIEQTVTATLNRVQRESNGRLAYSEVEAAELLGVERHTLRDCRLRGEVHARKVGKQFRYSKDSLLKFLAD